MVSLKIFSFEYIKVLKTAVWNKFTVIKRLLVSLRIADFSDCLLRFIKWSCYYCVYVSISNSAFGFFFTLMLKIFTLTIWLLNDLLFLIHGVFGHWEKIDNRCDERYFRHCEVWYAQTFRFFQKNLSLYEVKLCIGRYDQMDFCHNFVGTSKKIGRTETEEQLKDRIWNPLTIHEIHSLASWCLALFVYKPIQLGINSQSENQRCPQSILWTIKY